MRIGDLAGKTGVSKRLLRYYEEQGPLRPARLANGYREYGEADVTAVRHIRTLLAAGLPTAVIARLLHCVHDDENGRLAGACPGMITHLRRERRRLGAAIERLQTSQRALDTLLADVTTPRDGPQDGPRDGWVAGQGVTASS
ncbi:MerR family transcriptional regulator [Nonomuraea sp. K274]|uniref:MerR family transcriptional regulator n=1 Tax=Nonomuraea cypriaca TaxID=1187855 RepID=A0A931ADF6_9ACTN|nr:MerR family transcriptional regulator [Nonomuraea cypriaca]MBF8189868.1 MerR family transcriptional regulator [Nonomuraea cypriaca]